MKNESSGLGFDTPEAYMRARDVFSQAGYNEERVFKMLGGKFPSAPSAIEMPRLLRRAGGDSPLEILARLFLLGVSANVKTIRQALQPMKPEQWIRAGLMRHEKGIVSASIRIFPFRGLLIGIESSADRRAKRPDFVMDISGSTLTLINFTIRRKSQRTLDLGTGCGVQALLAAAHSGRVWATDMNPRALDFSRFNANLNGLSNIEFLQGDLFEPVKGKIFDRILFNPPFVISPESRFLYQDSGMRGDHFVQKIVRRVPKYLEENGYSQMICHWAHLHGREWQERFAKWVEGNGCDVWVIRQHTQDLASYIMSWIGGDTDPKRLAKRYDQWMDFYEQEKIEAISFGLITMRRRSCGANWFRADEWTEMIKHPIGDDILRGFEAQDFLEKMSDDKLLVRERLRVSPGTRLEQQCEPSGGGWRVVSARLLRVEGLGYSGAVEPPVATLIARCDGKHPLRDLLGELAASQGVDLESMTTAYLGVVRRLIARGMLLPPQAE